MIKCILKGIVYSIVNKICLVKLGFLDNNVNELFVFNIASHPWMCFDWSALARRSFRQAEAQLDKIEGPSYTWEDIRCWNPLLKNPSSILGT